MKRQLLAGRFGPDDREDIPAAQDEQCTFLQMVAGEKLLDHGIGGALTSLKKLGIFPSEVGIDLLVVAAHVHAADTRISRVEQSQDSWTREIRLVVPVSDPARWIHAIPTLTKALNFLTGDRWAIGFRARPSRFAAIAKESPPTLIEPPFDSVSLFSGGLDSLIGAIDLLQSGATPLLVSHHGEGATSDAQNMLFAGLKKQFDKSSFQRLQVGMKFKRGLFNGVSDENSTRGRSFLFFALGIFAGTGLGKSFALQVPENGLIALNVPLDPLRLGSNSTRAVSPETSTTCFKSSRFAPKPWEILRAASYSRTKPPFFALPALPFASSSSSDSSSSSAPSAPLAAPAFSVQSHIAVSRASGSKAAVSASLNTCASASLATAAQTCSRYSLSETGSPLAFSTRE
jgi:hypothetical protein